MPRRGPAMRIPATISTRPRCIGLDPDTGKIKQHFQYHWNDAWDWDEVDPPILAGPSELADATVKSLVHPGRNGYLWVLERGADDINFVSAEPFVHQDVFTEHRSEDRPAGIRSRQESRPWARR